MRHEDLLELGFRIFGEEEDDPFYKLIYKPPFNFGVTSLAGVLIEGSFWLYGNDKKYTNKDELSILINMLGNKINK